MVGETYHLYTRGVEKRNVFLSTDDWDRFTLLLLACNREEPVRIDNLLRDEQGEPLLKVREGERLVNILAWTLLPNHIHLIVRERREKGISRFMLKLMTAYSMYFNTKYERSGPLFTRPFRSRHVDSDGYLRWLFAYVALNPLDTFQRNWRGRGLRDKEQARRFLLSYAYSSFPDYAHPSRPQTLILTKEALPFAVGELRTMDALLSELSAGTSHTFATNAPQEIEQTLV